MLRRLRNRQFLSPVDAAWLQMEIPTNLMMITGVFMFDETLEYETLLDLIQSKLLKYERFKQRVINPTIGRPYWEDDPTFDIRAHILRIGLPEPGDQVTLQNLVNDFMSMPLDFSKPLWQFHLVENYNGGCALLCRLHHCIADGIALMKVLLDLTDDAPVSDADHDIDEPSTQRRRPTRANPFGKIDIKRYVDPEKSRDAIRLGLQSSAALANLLLLSPDPKTPFKGELGVRKNCAWTQPIPLADVKALGKVTGATVNDILITVTAGALGKYLRRLGEPIGGLNIRAVVPVNLRPPEEKPRLGNAFGLVFLSLPIGIDDGLDRLMELKRRMDKIKGTPEALVAFGILTFIGAAGDEIEDVVVNIFEQKATAVMTNVPGPREIRYFAGKAISGLMFWVPQSGRLALGISILSYAGKVLIGVAADAKRIPDPGSMVADIESEFEEMMQLVEWAKQAEAETAPG